MKTVEQRISDKLMMTRFILVVMVTLLCIFAMTITAYAYFTHDITFSSNVIKASKFDIKIVVEDLSNHQEMLVETLEEASYAVHLQRGHEYQVTIEKSGTASSGFCVIEVKDGVIPTYHTQQLGDDVNASGGTRQSISFHIFVNKDTTVTFNGHWGTSSKYADYVDKGANDEKYIEDGQTIYMGINGGTTFFDEEEKVEKPIQEEPNKTTKKPNKEKTDKEAKEEISEESSQDAQEEVIVEEGDEQEDNDDLSQEQIKEEKEAIVEEEVEEELDEEFDDELDEQKDIEEQDEEDVIEEQTIEETDE